MCQTLYSVLEIQQRTKFLLSTEIYNLLEKRIMKRMSTMTGTDFGLCIYKTVMYENMICWYLNGNNRVILKTVRKDADKVSLQKAKQAKWLLAFQSQLL